MSIAVFASGSGSNFENIAIASQIEGWIVPVSCLITDKPGAGAIKRAEKLGIPSYAIDPKQFPDKAAYEQEVLAILQKHDVSWLILAGYMRLIGPTLLNSFPGKILNVHPSLLPSFPGLDAIGQAFHHPVKCTGVTIHFVDHGMDTGPIIAQHAVEILETDSMETLTDKIHQIEHQLYPEVIRKLIQASR
ncbi:phosphoribosylglycinamide formyltransferase [Risungbinella massiliensis]|uniref:phosphoribosylglycinamide formyltransferase n=1 Tax=Risungbinella massiliensis TaxID=1329796 RepID=UPI0005CBA194|nr:phosphoribosylglycinamide formyltransferase [Risungbinella massiliensis]